jgi:hypothetical protein
MKNTLLKVVFGICIITFSACAPVKFYSNADLTKKSALKYYTVKPFIEIERDLATNNVVKSTVIYLPDLENPQFMDVRDGLGSRKVELKLSEGSINTLTIASDPKIAESIEAVGTLAAKVASAAQDLTTLKGLPPKVAATTITELYEVIMTNGVTSLRKVEIK